MLRFTAMFMVSVAVHVLFAAALPRIEITLKNPPDDTPVEIELVPVLPVPPEMAVGSLGDKPGRLAGALDDSLLTTEGSTPLVMPELDLPTSQTNRSADIEIPDIRTELPIDIPVEKRADSTVIGDASGDVKAVSTSGGEGLAGTPGSSDGKGEGRRRFFKLEKVTGTERTLAFVPKEPVFSLENDTKVVLQFSIDKNGTVRNVVFVERTDDRVERMALDFVRGMKFNAVLADTPDTSRITLYFRVK